MTFDDGGGDNVYGLNNPYTLQSAEFEKNVTGCVKCSFSYEMNQYICTNNFKYNMQVI